MAEIEIKILEINRAQVIEKLDALGAIKVFDDEHHAIYYDLPDKTLYNGGKALRLRKEGSAAMLTLKLNVPNATAKERIEHQAEVSDFIEMQSMLEALGYVPWLEMKKHRTSFEWDGSYFELDRYHDEYEFIPEFLEIESHNMGQLYRHAEILGFTKEDCKAWDAMQLISYYRRT